MRSTFYGMEAVRAGMYAAQTALDTTGHNISNVNTVGYTRQRVDTAAIPPCALNMLFNEDNKATSGKGVSILNIEQVRDVFLDAQYRDENANTGYTTTKYEKFSLVEDLFNGVLNSTDTQSSVFTALQDFYSALNGLADNPASKDLRTNLQQSAITLTESVNYLYDKLEEQHSNLNESIKEMVAQVNDITDSIANLNRQIYGYELAGAKANDLRDQRNVLLDKLSNIIDIEYYDNSQGQLMVTLGGRALINGIDSYDLTVDIAGENQLDVDSDVTPRVDQYIVKFADELGNPGVRPQDRAYIQSGSLRAVLDLRDGGTVDDIGIPYVVRELNELCRKVAKEMNEVHRVGYTMSFTGDDVLSDTTLYAHKLDPLTDEAIVTPGTDDYVWEELEKNAEGYYESRQGIDFFYAGATDDYKGVTAKSFRISDEIKENVYLVAASSVKVLTPADDAADGTNEYKGNFDTITKMIALYDKEDALGNPDNFESLLTGTVTGVGSAQSHFKDLNNAQKVRLNAIDQQRKATSEVSLDEEMTNVIRFIHAYNAAARMITTIDEQIDTIVNRMGTVGR